jgi:hypothetical protein
MTMTYTTIHPSRGRMTQPLLVTAVLLVVFANTLVAQAKPRPVRPWTVSISRSLSFGKSAGGVETAMRKGGFDDTDCFFSCIDHPFSSVGGANGLLTVRRSPRPRRQLVALYGTTDLAETLGYQSDTVAFAWGNFVFVRQSVRVAAVLAGVSTTSGATWLAAGPLVLPGAFRTERCVRGALPDARSSWQRDRGGHQHAPANLRRDAGTISLGRQRRHATDGRRWPAGRIASENPGELQPLHDQPRARRALVRPATPSAARA